MRKAFTNHVYNGVNLVFPNGNSISTIWRRGTYTENQNFTAGDLMESYPTLIEEGSSNAEVTITTSNEKLLNKIYRKCDTEPDNGVIGHVDINTWLWILNQLSKDQKARGEA